MARPKIKIDEVELEKLCNIQCTDVEIAAWLGCSVRTIQRLRGNAAFAERMDRARAKGRASVRRMLFGQAAKGNIAGIIFLAKNVLGYRDVIATEHSGPGGGPISIDQQVDISRLTDEEVELLEALHKKARKDEKK